MKVSNNNAEMMRLYAVNETPNKDGLYDLVPFDDVDFDDVDFDQEFECEQLDDRLDKLCKSLYGSDTYHGYTVFDDFSGCVHHGNGCGCGECFFTKFYGYLTWFGVPNIFGRLNADPNTATLHLLADHESKDGCWVVAVRYAA